MAGRPAKPIDLHIVSGNPSHLTKAEIEHRKKSEIHLGEQKLVCPVYVKTNKEAYKKWKEIKKLYTGFKFVSSADIGVIARYCMAFAQYIDLIERRDKIARIELTGEETTATQEILEAEYSQRKAAKLYEKIEYILSTGGIMAMDKAINAKMSALVQMEDRLFLSPLAKVKNVPKEPEKKDEDPLSKKGFDV